jgi:hypothetical protein
VGPWGEGRDRSGRCSEKGVGKEKKEHVRGECGRESSWGQYLARADITVYVEGRAMTRRRAFNIAWSVLGHLQVDDVRAHYRDALPSSSLGPFLRAR